MTSMIHFPAYVIGLMSGTSADGVDAALIETDGRQHVRTDASVFVPYDDALRRAILALMRGEGDEAAIAEALTRVHITAVEKLLAATQVAVERIKLIGFHGQTIRHAPHEGITVQIGDAALLARATRIPVVADFRTNDVKHGGQGAPLVPLYHAALAAAQPKPLMVVNIGGVANVTWIGEFRVQSSEFSEGKNSELWTLNSELLSFDCGPGNALLDDWVHQHTGARYDKGGELAARGVVDEVTLWQWLDDPFFKLPAPKSLDRLHFSLFLQSVTPADAGVQLGNTQQKMDPGLRRGDTPWSLETGAATLTAFTAAAIARACELVPQRPERLLITGGGRHNPTLMHMIKTYSHCQVDAVEHLGWNGDMLEAEAFAYLAARSVQGLPLSLPTTTGVKEPCTGGVFFPVEA